MIDVGRVVPPALSEAHEIGFDYRGGDGVEFEPYDDFLTEAETREWWRAWTGNHLLDGREFCIFGQDGTGGLAGFWLARAGEPIAGQPVVFLGSEGETGVVARDLAAYLWLLADGYGPLEATMYPRHAHDPCVDVRLAGVAERYAPTARRSAPEIIAAARGEFPDFADMIGSLCR